MYTQEELTYSWEDDYFVTYNNVMGKNYINVDGRHFKFRLPMKMLYHILLDVYNKSGCALIQIEPAWLRERSGYKTRMLYFAMRKLIACGVISRYQTEDGVMYSVMSHEDIHSKLLKKVGWSRGSKKSRKKSLERHG